MRGAESRVTLDLDSVDESPIQAIRAYHALQRAAEEVEVRISSGGRGLHLIGYFTERLDETAKERLRRSLGDDAKRLELDNLRGSAATSQVLWTEKDGRTVDTDFGDVYAALDYVQMTG